MDEQVEQVLVVDSYAWWVGDIKGEKPATRNARKGFFIADRVHCMKGWRTESEFHRLPYRPEAYPADKAIEIVIERSRGK